MNRLPSILAISSLLLLGAGCFSKTAQPTATGSADIAIVINADSPTDPELHPLMLGVISGPDPIGGSVGPSVVEQYQEYGVTTVRNNDYYDDRLDLTGIFNCGGTTYPSWEGCDANDDKNYFWDLSDKQYQSYIDGGFVPFLRVGTAAENPSHPHAYISPQNATQQKNLIIAARKMVDRYEHWPAHPNAFTYLDLWTEFPGHLWDAPKSTFYPFWAELYVALKAEHPELKIGGPGLLGDPTEDEKGSSTSESVKFLTELYNRKAKLDWFGWHIFNHTPELYATRAAQFKDLLAGTGEFSDVPWAKDHFFADTEVFVDAYNLNQREEDNRDEVSRPQGAARSSVMTAVWIAMQYADVEGAYYYRGNEQGDRDEPQSNSLIGFHGEPRMNAYAFRLFARLTERYDTILTTSIPADDSIKNIWALAAKNAQGGTALLLANITDSPKTFTVTLPDGTSITDAVQATMRVVDDENLGDTDVSLTDNVVTIPANGVELIELSR